MMPDRMEFSRQIQTMHGRRGAKEMKKTILSTFQFPISCWCFSSIEPERNQREKESISKSREQNGKRVESGPKEAQGSYPAQKAPLNDVVTIQSFFFFFSSILLSIASFMLKQALFHLVSHTATSSSWFNHS